MRHKKTDLRSWAAIGTFLLLLLAQVAIADGAGGAASGGAMQKRRIGVGIKPVPVMASPSVPNPCPTGTRRDPSDGVCYDCDHFRALPYDNVPADIRDTCGICPTGQFAYGPVIPGLPGGNCHPCSFFRDIPLADRPVGARRCRFVHGDNNSSSSSSSSSSSISSSESCGPGLVPAHVTVTYGGACVEAFFRSQMQQNGQAGYNKCKAAPIYGSAPPQTLVNYSCQNGVYDADVCCVPGPGYSSSSSSSSTCSNTSQPLSFTWPKGSGTCNSDKLTTFQSTEFLNANVTGACKAHPPFQLSNIQQQSGRDSCTISATVSCCL